MAAHAGGSAAVSTAGFVHPVPRMTKPSRIRSGESMRCGALRVATRPGWFTLTDCCNRLPVSKPRAGATSLFNTIARNATTGPDTERQSLGR